jgi:hypothetical protein
VVRWDCDNLAIGDVSDRLDEKTLYWFIPVKGATLTVDRSTHPRMSLFRATSFLFALPPDRTMILLQNSGGQKQTYAILGPGPGHLPATFKGSIRRCESVFIGTPFFGFVNDTSICVQPPPNRDDNREAKFAPRFVEFTSDDDKRIRLEW